MVGKGVKSEVSRSSSTSLVCARACSLFRNVRPGDARGPRRPGGAACRPEPGGRAIATGQNIGRVRAARLVIEEAVAVNKWV
jgi:hypothetical protein